jgi:GNAT superfamily N-acetyltransferase
MVTYREVLQLFDLSPLIAEISELRPVDPAKIVARTANDEMLVVAEVDGRFAGFKLGYAFNKSTFYSWLGGVAPAFRGRGIARELLRFQERLVLAPGYLRIRVKSMERFPAMLGLLESEGYVLIAKEREADEDEKLVFEKILQPVQ